MFEGREFSCRPLPHLLQRVVHAGHRVEDVLRGIDYPLSHLMDGAERIDWESVRVLGRNLSAIWSDHEILSLGLEALRSRPLRSLGAMARYVFTPAEYYAFATRELPRYCACLTASSRWVTPAELHVSVYMLPGYEPVHELFVALRGALMSLTEVYGRQHARVEMEELDARAVYRIRVPDRGGPLRWIRPWFTWGLTARGAARELHEAHMLLYERHVALMQRDQQIRESERMHRALVEQAFDPILIMDGAGRLLHANAQACEAFGEPLEALRKRTPSELIEVPGIERRRFLESLRERGADRVEGLARRPDGSTFPVEIGCSVLTDGRVQAVLRDIRERRRAEEERRRYEGELEVQVGARTAELERANAELRELQARFVQAERMRVAEAATVRLVRSINNPLTALIGTLEMAAESPSDARRAVRQGLHLARRIRSTVADDLPLDGSGAARRSLESPEGILADLEAALRQLARAHGIRIETKVEARLPSVRVDRALLVEALVALSTNGIEAMQHGQTLSVQAELLRTVGVVQFRIIDEGAGIPRDIAERVLEPCFTTKPSRAGLGLPIALGIVQGHGGRLVITERPGGGTVASVEVRAATA